jgi:hypothetical protein
MKMASDWSSLPQAGKWRSKLRTSCTNESTSWHFSDGHTFNQIGHCLIDGRHFSEVIHVMARRGANIVSDHMLVIIKLRARICRASNTNPQQLRRFAFDRRKDRDVASRYYDELESELEGVQAQPLGLDERCKKLEETIQRVAANTIGYTRKQAYKEWFDEECAEVNEEKNATRERAIQNNTRGNKKAYKLARTKERRLFRKKARQLDEEALIEIERNRSIQDSRKFYKRLNDVRRPFQPQVAMCRAKNGELLTNKNQEQARWKEHFEEHSNEGFVSEPPTRPVDLRDDGVDIDLPSR